MYLVDNGVHLVHNVGMELTTITAILDRINGYVGDNLWEDVIYGLPGFDGDATEAADRAGESDTIVFADGTVLDCRGGSWAER